MKKDKEKAMKKEEKMAPQHEAKRHVLKALSDEMRRHMGEGIKSHMEPMKKVSVMAPDSESLKKGLEVASKLSPAMEDMGEAADEAMHGMHEEPRDMDQAAADSEEMEHQMPMDHADLMAEHDNDDEENQSEMEKLRKHLSRKA